MLTTPIPFPALGDLEPVLPKILELKSDFLKVDGPSVLKNEKRKLIKAKKKKRKKVNTKSRSKRRRSKCS